jgi:hypothetical protein
MIEILPLGRLPLTLPERGGEGRGRGGRALRAAGEGGRRGHPRARISRSVIYQRNSGPASRRSRLSDPSNIAKVCTLLAVLPPAFRHPLRPPRINVPRRRRISAAPLDAAWGRIARTAGRGREGDDEEDGPSASEDTSHRDHSAEAEPQHWPSRFRSTREMFTGGMPARGGSHNGGMSFGGLVCVRTDREARPSQRYRATSRSSRQNCPLHAVRHRGGCAQRQRILPVTFRGHRADKRRSANSTLPS